MRLAKGNLLNIGRKPGAVIRVEEGALWLTQDGDITDYVVLAGETRRLDRQGTAIVSAFRDSCFQVIAPETAVGVFSALVTALSRKLQPQG